MILGIDPGERRVGVAEADEETRLARPLEVIDARQADPVTRIAELVAEREVTLIVVGRPVGLAGRAGPSVDVQQGFVQRLTAAVAVEVREFDERLTTVIAEQGLRAAGGDKRSRAAMRDAVAAQVMLQGYLDAERWH